MNNKDLVKVLWPYVVMFAGIGLWLAGIGSFSALVFDVGASFLGYEIAKKIDYRLTFVLIIVWLAAIGGYLDWIQIFPFEWISSPFTFFSQSPTGF